MKNLIRITFLIVFCIITKNILAQEITCKIKGKVIGSDSKVIKLVLGTEAYDLTGILIPINNNMFEYDLKAPCIEKYQLVFKEEAEKGGVRPIEFFPDSEIIEFTVYPSKEFNKNIIKGGELNRQKTDFERPFNSKLEPLYNILDSLNKTNRYFTDKYQKLTDLINQAKAQGSKEEMDKLVQERRSLKMDEVLTPEVLIIQNKVDSIYHKKKEWQLNYIKTNQNIFSYSLLYREIDNYNKETDIDFIKAIYPSFSKKYPSHPYTKKIEEMLNAINTIRVGGHYIDFSAPTIDGKIVKISDEIKDKVALIDLWSSWCGPCRTLGKSMIPIYEKYKSKGFTIVGVASEYKNTDAFKSTIEKDKYPWLNLIDLDNKIGIWNKYGIANAGGATFLVDSTGKILEITPTADKLDKLLSELLK